MRRFPLAIAAVSLFGAAAAPAVASATEVQVGQTSTALVAPTCPAGTTAASCTILLTEETGLQTVSNGMASPDTVTQTGAISAFYVGISSAAQAYVASLDKQYGGVPQVELTVLRPVYTGAIKRYQVAAQGPLENLTNYQGHVVEFGLPEELPVVKGEVLALTTPTWAPVLSIQMPTGFAYVQSRVGNCAGKQGQPAYYNPQTTLGDTTSYGCSFPSTRVEYSAVEITTPTISAAERMARQVRHGDAIRPRIIKTR